MKDWIEAARPRTLPLALSSILMGSFLAMYAGKFSWNIFWLAVLTTILLQVMSNFANDYGDTQNGADTEKRLGPSRAVQSGKISPRKMFTAVIITGILAFSSGLSLLLISFKNGIEGQFWIFLLIGLLCILAAYFYTAGKKPYGYAGLGDISVLIFFGLVGVMACQFLYTKDFNLTFILPALSCGFLATGVLNLNNIRDIESDAETGKRTIPVRIGKKAAINYHWFLLISAIVCMVIFAVLAGNISWYFMIPSALVVLNGIQLEKIENPDPLLKRLALTTLLFVLCSGLSMFY